MVDDRAIHLGSCPARYGDTRCNCGAVTKQPPQEEVVTTPFGRFLVTRGELIGETTRAGTLWDGPGFLQVIAKEHGALGERGATILDVGANQGAFSVWLATHGAWRVIAVEPEPTVMARLKANLDLNREVTADVVVPVEAAAYHTKCALAMDALDPGNWGATAARHRSIVADKAVLAIPLDTLRPCFGQRVSLIKLDVQGCEGPALLGLEETLRRDHPVVVFEWETTLAERHGWAFQRAVDRFVAHGYAVTPWPTNRNNFLALPKERR